MRPLNRLILGVSICLISSGIWAQVSIGGYNVYYGHLHNHCSYSDGSGTPAQAYAYARDNGKLDFFSLADHEYSLTSTEYASIINTANSYNQDGVFTAFYGFEWSHSTYGHVAVIGSSDYCFSGSSPTNTFSGLVNWLSSRECIAFFNHPGRQNGTPYVEFNHFTSIPSEKFVGMELWNKTDRFSTYYYTDGYFSGDNTKGWYDEALIRDWKIGASGSEDNHSGTWGTMANSKMAVLATTKTRTDIMNALKAKRFYSTYDKNLGLSFKIDGKEMGSTIAGGNYTMQILACDGTSDVFSQVQLLKDGTVINTWTPGTTSVTITQTISCVDGEYYYIRVKQSDADEAISSPIWIVGGITNISPNVIITAPANNTVFKEPATVNITADATDSDGRVVKVEFYQGTTLLGSDNTSPYTFTWSNVAGGSYSLTAKGTDDDGAVTTSSVVNITVNVTPVTYTFSKRISAGIDDVEEYASGTMLTNSDDIELVYDTNTTGNQIVGLRFNTITIPPGASITKAYIQFATDEKTSSYTSLIIKGQSEDNAAAFTKASKNVSSRAKTIASVLWTPSNWTQVGAMGTAQQTTGLTSIVQEIVNRSGWVSGNSMVFIVSGSGKRTAESYEGSSSKAALLYVEYTYVNNLKKALLANNVKEERITDALSQGRFTCYPVPFTDLLHIQFVPSEFENIKKVELFNSSGILVRDIITNENLISVSVPGIQPGIYLIRIVTDAGYFTQTVIKK